MRYYLLRVGEEVAAEGVKGDGAVGEEAGHGSGGYQFGGGAG